MKRLIFVAGMAMLATPVHAGLPSWFNNIFGKSPIDYGAWHCSNCAIPAAGTPVSATIPADINAFIKFNNPQIHDSKNERVHRWIENSKITICDAANCLTVVFKSGIGGWLPMTGSWARYENLRVRVPQNDETVQFPRGGSGVVSVNPIGPADYTPSGLWSMRFYNLPPSVPGRWVTPSVTVIQGDSSTEFVGAPIYFDSVVAPEVGGMLDWSFESTGLDWGNDYGGGGGGGGSYYHYVLE